MRLSGGIFYDDRAITASIRAMHLDSEIIGIGSENINGFDKIGYQRKEPVVSSFAQYLGVHALSSTRDDQVGRIAKSPNPLDVALAHKGYFQVQTENGTKLTRDGRFKITPQGYLTDLQDAYVLSNAGVPIKFDEIPKDLKAIKIDNMGKITMFDEKSRKLKLVAQLGVVDTNGVVVVEPEIKQGYNEFSNVSLQQEFMTMMPYIRNYDANIQMFKLQNSVLGKTISQLSQ